MRNKKCFGLLSLFFIMLGLSLGVFSENSHALRYDILEYPFTGQMSISSYNSEVASETAWSFQFDSDYAPTLLDDRYFNARLNASGTNCQYWTNPAAPKIWSSWSSGSDTYLNASIPVNLYRSPDYWGNYDLGHCMDLGSFGSGDILAMDWSTISGSVLLQSQLNGYNPYRFPYSGAYASDLDVSDGLHRGTRLEFDNLFSSVPASAYGHLKSFTLPLGYPGEAVGQLISGRNLQFNLIFALDSNSDVNADFGGDYNFTLYSIFQNSSSLGVPCDVSLKDYRNNQDRYPYELEVQCSWTSDFDYNLGQITFMLEATSLTTGGYLWSYPADRLGIVEAYVVSDYNNTLSSSPFASTVIGGDLSSAPGSAQNPSSDTQDDFLSSLINMFSFNLLNPFAPMFGLFVDNNTCGHIPIIAGMLHAESDVYCPWFSSNTRRILTPVLGIAGTMLLFGFFVRWLGSSSGNLFEDSAKETISSVNGSGFRRYKK